MTDVETDSNATTIVPEDIDYIPTDESDTNESESDRGSIITKRDIILDSLNTLRCQVQSLSKRNKELLEHVQSLEVTTRHCHEKMDNNYIILEAKSFLMVLIIIAFILWMNQE